MLLPHLKKETGAVFSPCRVWRYRLWRVWNARLPVTAFIGLNPSTATETEDDPTIRRCIRFAKDFGSGTLIMLNLFAFRSKDPVVMRKTDVDPIGADNDKTIVSVCSEAQTVVVAWGVHGSHQDRDVQVLRLLSGNEDINLRCLGVTKDGMPKHPLYLPSDVVPFPYCVDFIRHRIKEG